MENIEKEVQELEDEIKEKKANQGKQEKIKNLKIFKAGVRRVAPYVIGTTLLVTPACFLGITPFYRNDITKETPKYIKEADNNGNVITTEYQKEDIDNVTQTFKYYSKWKEKEDGTYERNVKTWDIGMEYNEEILNALLEKENVSLEGVFGNPDTNRVQTKEFLTEEEQKNNEDLLKATIFSGSKEVIIKESLEREVGLTIVMLLVVALLHLAIAADRSRNKYNYKRIIEKIKQEYRDYQYEIEDLEEELKTKIRQRVLKEQLENNKK